MKLLIQHNLFNKRHKTRCEDFKEEKKTIHKNMIILNLMFMLQSDLKETSDSENSQSKCIKEYAHKIIGEWSTLRVQWITCESVRHQVKSSI